VAQSNQSTDLALAGGGVDSPDTEEQQEQKSGYLSALNGVDVLRQVTLVIALAICLAIAIFIIIWARQPDMRPLGKMPTEELIQTLDFLDAQKIDYELDGNVISVEEGEYQNIKLLMAREGLEQAPSSGTDIIMQDMGFGVSQRLERERLNMAVSSSLRAPLKS